MAARDMKGDASAVWCEEGVACESSHMVDGCAGGGCIGVAVELKVVLTVLVRAECHEAADAGAVGCRCACEAGVSRGVCHAVGGGWVDCVAPEAGAPLLAVMWGVRHAADCACASQAGVAWCASASLQAGVGMLGVVERLAGAAVLLWRVLAKAVDVEAVATLAEPHKLTGVDA